MRADGIGGKRAGSDEFLEITPLFVVLSNGARQSLELHRSSAEVGLSAIWPFVHHLETPVQMTLWDLANQDIIDPGALKPRKRSRKVRCKRSVAFRVDVPDHSLVFRFNQQGATRGIHDHLIPPDLGRDTAFHLPVPFVSASVFSAYLNDLMPC